MDSTRAFLRTHPTLPHWASIPAPLPMQTTPVQIFRYSEACRHTRKTPSMPSNSFSVYERFGGTVTSCALWRTDSIQTLSANALVSQRKRGVHRQIVVLDPQSITRRCIQERSRKKFGPRLHIRHQGFRRSFVPESQRNTTAPPAQPLLV